MRGGNRKGAGRPASGLDLVKAPWRLDASIIELVREQAEYEGETQRTIVEHAIVNYLESCDCDAV